MLRTTADDNQLGLRGQFLDEVLIQRAAAGRTVQGAHRVLFAAGVPPGVVQRFGAHQHPVAASVDRIVHLAVVIDREVAQLDEVQTVEVGLPRAARDRRVEVVGDQFGKQTDDVIDRLHDSR